MLNDKEKQHIVAGVLPLSGILLFGVLHLKILHVKEKQHILAGVLPLSVAGSSLVAYPPLSFQRQPKQKP